MVDYVLFDTVESVTAALETDHEDLVAWVDEYTTAETPAAEEQALEQVDAYLERFYDQKQVADPYVRELIQLEAPLKNYVNGNEKAAELLPDPVVADADAVYEELVRVKTAYFSVLNAFDETDDRILEVIGPRVFMYEDEPRKRMIDRVPWPKQKQGSGHLLLKEKESVSAEEQLEAAAVKAADKVNEILSDPEQRRRVGTAAGVFTVGAALGYLAHRYRK